MYGQLFPDAHYLESAFGFPLLVWYFSIQPFVVCLEALLVSLPFDLPPNEVEVSSSPSLF